MLNIIKYLPVYHVLFESYLGPVMTHHQLESSERAGRLLVGDEMHPQAF